MQPESESAVSLSNGEALNVSVSLVGIFPGEKPGIKLPVEVYFRKYVFAGIRIRGDMGSPEAECRSEVEVDFTTGGREAEQRLCVT